jgi:hypothetical protein
MGQFMRVGVAVFAHADTRYDFTSFSSSSVLCVDDHNEDLWLGCLQPSERSFFASILAKPGHRKMANRAFQTIMIVDVIYLLTIAEGDVHAAPFLSMYSRIQEHSTELLLLLLPLLLLLLLVVVPELVLHGVHSRKNIQKGNYKKQQTSAHEEH